MAKINFDILEATSAASSYLTQNTPITPVNNGGLGKVLIDSSLISMAKGFNEVDRAAYGSSPITATGDKLDEWGTIVGLKRRQPKYAEVNSQDRNFKFFVSANKTFGTINNNNPIVIPAGTTVFAGVPSKNGTTVAYQITNSIVLPASETEFYFSAIALGQGSSYNVPDNIIRYHSFKGYSDQLNGTLRVTNESAIANGQSKETDADFRRRVLSLMRGEVNSINEVVNIIRAIHGVSNVIIFPNIDGLGVITIIVQGVTPITSSKLISNIEKTIAEKFTSEGLVMNIRSPNYIGIGVDISVEHQPQMSEADRISLEYEFQRAINKHISELNVGVGFSMKQLRQIVAGFQIRFKSIGTTSDLIDKVYIYKDSFGIRSPQRITGDYVVAKTEKIIVEYSVDTPINIIRV